MFKTEDLSSAVHVATRTRADLDGLLVDALVAMASRISQLEARLDCLSDATMSKQESFDARVLSVIEDNSFTVYTHIEAEIEGKLEDMTQSYDFAAAVEEAVKGSIVGTVEGVVEDIVHDAIVDAIGDAEDIVRKGLRAIL